MSSYLELLEFLNIELIFSDHASDHASLEDLTIDEADNAHAVTTSLPNQSPNDFEGLA